MPTSSPRRGCKSMKPGLENRHPKSILKENIRTSSNDMGSISPKQCRKIANNVSFFRLLFGKDANGSMRGGGGGRYEKYKGKILIKLLKYLTIFFCRVDFEESSGRQLEPTERKEKLHCRL